jgi:hypothetical protein
MIIIENLFFKFFTKYMYHKNQMIHIYYYTNIRNYHIFLILVVLKLWLKKFLSVIIFFVIIKYIYIMNQIEITGGRKKKMINNAMNNDETKNRGSIRRSSKKGSKKRGSKKGSKKRGSKKGSKKRGSKKGSKGSKKGSKRNHMAQHGGVFNPFTSIEKKITDAHKNMKKIGEVIETKRNDLQKQGNEFLASVPIIKKYVSKSEVGTEASVAQETGAPTEVPAEQAEQAEQVEQAESQAKTKAKTNAKTNATNSKAKEKTGAAGPAGPAGPAEPAKSAPIGAPKTETGAKAGPVSTGAPKTGTGAPKTGTGAPKTETGAKAGPVSTGAPKTGASKTETGAKTGAVSPSKIVANAVKAFKASSSPKQKKK